MADRRTSEMAQGKAIAPTADEVWGWTSPAGRVRWRRRAEMLGAGLRSGQRVLELGCGTGLLTQELVRAGVRVVAVDISEDLLVKARERTGGKAEFLRQDIESLDVGPELFDAVVGSSILHHVDARRVLIHAYRAVKRGGILRFTEPNMMNPQIFLQKNIPWLKRRLKDTPGETAFFKKNIKALLDNLGFVQVSVENFDFLHPSVPGFCVPAIDRLGRRMEKISVVKEFSGSLFIQARG